MNDFWSAGWGWGDPNSHLRVSGRQLLDHADRVGWQLYTEERSLLADAPDVEVYLDEPLDELNAVTFGAAVDKFRGRVRKRDSGRIIEATPAAQSPIVKNKKKRRSKPTRHESRDHKWR